MSRRARSRLLARELKRGETYLSPEPEPQDEDGDGGTPDEGNAPDAQAHPYQCPCCSRTGPNHFWCGQCSTGATLAAA